MFNSYQFLTAFFSLGMQKLPDIAKTRETDKSERYYKQV